MVVERWELRREGRLASGATEWVREGMRAGDPGFDDEVA